MLLRILGNDLVKVFCHIHALEQTHVVVRGELEVVQVLRLAHIQTILTVQELDDGTVGITNRGVMLNPEAFHTLDHTALQVTRARGLDSGINQTFSTSHSVEVELLRSHTSQETVDNVTTSADRGLEGLEARQCLSGHHDGNSATFQNLLTKVTRDLVGVDTTTLCT